MLNNFTLQYKNKKKKKKTYLTKEKSIYSLTCLGYAGIISFVQAYESKCLIHKHFMDYGLIV